MYFPEVQYVRLEPEEFLGPKFSTILSQLLKKDWLLLKDKNFEGLCLYDGKT